MSAIQLLESLSTNPSYKSAMLADNASGYIEASALNEIKDMEQNEKLWCIFLPAEDETPSEDEKDDESPEDSIRH